MEKKKEEKQVKKKWNLRSCWFPYHLRLPFSFWFFFCFFYFAFFPSLSFFFRRLHFAYILINITYIIHICWYTLWHRCIDETNLLRRKNNLYEKEFVIRTNTQAQSTLISIYRASTNNNNNNSHNSNTNVTFSFVVNFHPSGGTKTKYTHTHTNTHSDINKKVYLTQQTCICK